MAIDLTPLRESRAFRRLRFGQAVSFIGSIEILEAGLVAPLAGVRASIVSGGIACVAGAVLLSLRLPQLNRYDSRHPRA